MSKRPNGGNVARSHKQRVFCKGVFVKLGSSSDVPTRRFNSITGIVRRAFASNAPAAGARTNRLVVWGLWQAS